MSILRGYDCGISYTALKYILIWTYMDLYEKTFAGTAFRRKSI